MTRNLKENLVDSIGKMLQNEVHKANHKAFHNRIVINSVVIVMYKILTSVRVGLS